MTVFHAILNEETRLGYFPYSAGTRFSFTDTFEEGKVIATFYPETTGPETHWVNLLDLPYTLLRSE